MLGCLLFCLYINDITESIKEDNDITLFADDTSLLVTGNSVKEAKEFTCKELNNMHNWITKNEMALNIQKTKYIEFHWLDKTDENEVEIKSIKLEKVENINFLGVVIDKRLNFKKHIEKIVNKLKMIATYCYKIRNKLDDRGRKMIYYALVYSTISYGIEVYTNTTWNILKPLDYIHKRIIKILYNIPKRTATKEVYLSLKLLDLRHIISLQLAKIGHNWAQNKLPNKLQELFRRKEGTMETRQVNCIYKRISKTNIEQRAIDYRVGRYWNDISKDIKTLNENSFKKVMKGYYLERIREKVKGEYEDKYF